MISSNILIAATTILNYLLSLFIDLILMKNIRKDVNNKIKLSRSKKVIDTAIDSLKKNNRMVLMNAWYFAFLINILLIAFSNYLYFFCTGYISCNDFNELAAVFNFFSISFQFFILKKFNKLFNENFDDFCKDFIKKN